MSPPLIKARETRELLRQRERNYVPYDQPIPGSRVSKASPSTQSLSKPTGRPPRSHIRIRKSMVREQYANQLRARIRLMFDKSTGVLDFTNIDPDIDTDAHEYVDELHLTESDDERRGFHIYLSVGFAGYEQWSPPIRRELPLRCLENPTAFRACVVQANRRSLIGIGLNEEDCEVSGYEIELSIEYVSEKATIPAGERVLVRSLSILRAWAEQPTAVGSIPYHIVMRITKGDGTRFDPTFRRPREAGVGPISLDDSVELDMPDLYTVYYNADVDAKARSRSASTKLDPAARQEKVARKAIQRYEMYRLEHMMSHQNLTGGNQRVPGIRASGSGNGVTQQSNETGHAGTELEGIEQNLMDFEVDPETEGGVPLESTI